MGTVNSNAKSQTSDDVGVAIHTREGFVGDVCAMLRPNSVHQYTEVSGPHAPHRVELAKLRLPDREDPKSVAAPFLAGRSGLAISASALARPTPYVFKNTEFDELHFIQEGELDFVTAFGTLRAEPSDFVYLARSVGYRLEPVSTSTLRLIVEIPERLRFATSQPFGIVDFARHVIRPDASKPSVNGPKELWLKSFDGITRYVMRGDPLAFAAVLGGPLPVWKLNLTHIAQQTTTSGVCPPAQFAETPTRSSLFFTLSSRVVGRPPHHDNADYDEVILYFRGPGAWGAVDTPGVLTWVPKGTTHWGAAEEVPEGYWAWLLECSDTLRLTKAADGAAELMETGLYGPLRSGSA
jgi:homogentisate 1,2-dioxygenase